MRTLIIAAALLSSLALPAAAESYTTRIEPRAFYGATVTIEEGVRVFRPLPTQRHVIVNPGGQTPLNLSYNDTRVQEHSTSTNYNYNQGGGSGVYGGGYGVGGFGSYGYGPHRGGHGNIGGGGRNPDRSFKVRGGHHKSHH